MAQSNVLRMTFTAIVALVASIAEAEPTSFIARVQQAQGLAPGSATSVSMAARSNGGPAAGEPASFIARVEKSQGIELSGREAERSTEAGDAARTSEGEPTSFIARVQKSQLPVVAMAR
jgi:hypothetical protein